MNDPKLLDEIESKLSDVLSSSPARDLEKNLHALLGAFFERFDVVTREDFEAQKRVLERARDRISELESRLVRLEPQANSQDPHTEPSA